MNEATGQPQRRHTGMSYKFQRLREKIRQAVASGELSGKLPGERELARRFHVNAKTLSKALTDLAAEGLLQRNIGRGTFVKGQTPADESGQGPWLLIADADGDQTLVQNLKALNPQAQVVEDITTLRPSFLSQFSAVVDMAEQTPDAFIRDLLVRNLPVVAVGREQRSFSTNAVLMDCALAATYVARDLILGGHRRFVAIEGRTRSMIAQAIRQTASRCGIEVSVDSCFPGDAVYAMDQGATACICESVRAATQTLAAFAAAGLDVPGRASLATIGWTGDERPCSGYYVPAQQKAAAVAEILRQTQPGRPTTLWLTGIMVDRGTTGQAQGTISEMAEPPIHRFPSLALASTSRVG